MHARTGLCRGCACVKARRSCVNCLPGKLGNCANATSNVPMPSSSTCATTHTNLAPTSTFYTSLSSNIPNITQAIIQPTPSITTASIPNNAPQGSVDSLIQQPSSSATIQPSNVICQPVTATVPRRPLPDQQALNFRWGEHSGEAILDVINSSYEEVIHWKPNLLLVPFGSAGTSFVKEVAHLFQAFADKSSLERVSMKAITLIQTLLLQKPSKKSKTKDHISHLK